MTDKEKLDAIRAEIHRLVDVRGYDRGMAIDLFAFMDLLPNEPVSNDLEEAARKAGQKYFPDEENIWARPNYEAKKAERAFKEGANWGRNQAKVEIQAQSMALAHGCPKEEPASESLEEAAKNHKSAIHIVSPQWTIKSDIMEGIVGDFEKGITHSYLTIKIPMLLCPSNCAKGDKVKIIIVMEE